MDFLNIGSGEFVFLALLAILLVGPKRAAEWTSQISRFMARIRQEWFAVQQDLMREVQALQKEPPSTLQPLFQEVRPGYWAPHRESAGGIPSAPNTAQEVPAFQAPSASMPEILEPSDDWAG